MSDVYIPQFILIIFGNYLEYVAVCAVLCHYAAL